MALTIRQATQILSEFNGLQPSRREMIAHDFLLFRARKRADKIQQAWYEPTSSFDGKGPGNIPGDKRATLVTAVNAMCRGIFLDKV